MTIGEAHGVIGRLELSATQRQIAARDRARGDSDAAGVSRGSRPELPEPRPRERHAPAANPQRIRLAAQIGSRLAGVLYVLDEPSIGLHQRDNDRLISTLRRLRDLGNSVIVVEHDEDTIRAADHIVDIGPGAGPRGGRLVAQGTLEEVLRVENSPTAQYLTGRLTIPVPAPPPPAAHPSPPKLPPARRSKPQVPRRIAQTASGWLEIDRRDERTTSTTSTPRFRFGCMTCVTGVSGSGKSTLVDDILRRALAWQLYRAKDAPGKHERIDRHRADRPRHRHRPEPHRAQPALEPGDVHGRVRPDP